MGLLQYLWLLPVGLALGFLGTLIGAGGGFLLVPLLLFAYPHESPAIITGIALAVVGLNAASGSAVYAIQRRIDFHSGSIFALATVPGAIGGAYLANTLPRHTFNLCFGLALLAAAAFLIWRPQRDEAPAPPHLRDTPRPAAHPRLPPRRIAAGAAMSTAVGFISSLLGIGGGIVHVPALVHLLNFSVHVATATSHFILAITAGTGTAVHVLTGSMHHGWRRVLVLGVGVILGAPLGARLSQRIHGAWIVRALAVALGLVGVRLVWMAIT